MPDTFPSSEMALTHILVVSDIEKSKYFYKNILGADLYREYGGTSIVFKFLGSWLLVVSRGEPTKDKPDVYFETIKDKNSVSHAMTIRVPDCHSAYKTLKSRGAVFLTEPVDWDSEVRCFFHDPDGHLFEISEAK